MYAVAPLYAAAYRDDVDAIKKLAKLKVDPNIQHPDSGYTALHVAVFKYKLNAVVALLTEFKDTLIFGIDDDDALHSHIVCIFLYQYCFDDIIYNIICCIILYIYHRCG